MDVVATEANWSPGPVQRDAVASQLFPVAPLEKSRLRVARATNFQEILEICTQMFIAAPS